ncbi:MAG TPA: hypothetical protein VKV74_19120 [Bryobacteraceae bacterium]|nr:hypothetical protein [Bryobacteraceae bacterium]
MPTAEHDVRFEPADIEPHSVLLTGLCLFGAVLIIVFATFLFGSLLTQARRQAGALPQAAAAVPRRLPPEPRLQPSPRDEWQAYHDEQMQQLNSYRWVDRDKGVVAIPITRAMELIVQRGIPPQKAAARFQYNPPEAGTRQTGFEGKAEAEPK